MTQSIIELLPAIVTLILWAFSLVSIPFAIYHRQWDRLHLMIVMFGMTFIGVFCGKGKLYAFSVILGLIDASLNSG